MNYHAGISYNHGMTFWQRILLISILSFGTFLGFTPSSPGAESNAKDSEEALEVWGKIRGDETAALSTESMEKNAVNFGKIDNALCAAASAGNQDQLESMLRDGASPDSVDSLGISALSHAILAGNKHSAILMLSAGAHVNQKGPFGVTPLLLATNSRQKEMLGFLLLNGADPALKSDDGETPLSLAKRKGYVEIQTLLEPPAPAKPKEEKRAAPPPAAQPPVDLTLSKQTADVLPAPPAPSVSALDLQLIEAVQHGDGPRVSELLQKGANPNTRLENGISPLAKAVEQDDLRLTEILLRSGAQADIRAQFNMTPLMMAAQGNQTEIARVLLRAGADPRAKNIVGQSACDLAAASLNETIQKVFDVCSR